MTSTESDEMPVRDMNSDPQQSATTSSAHGEMPIKAMNEESGTGQTLAEESIGQAQAIDVELAHYLQEQQSKARGEQVSTHGEMPVKGME
jgi:hypothetical protein